MKTLQNGDSSTVRPDWAHRLRKEAFHAFTAGVAAADPKRAVTEALSVRDGRLRLHRADGSVRTADWRCVRVVAFGKAALSMAEAAGKSIPAPLMAGPGVAVTNYENARELNGFEVVAAGHPLPDANGARGAQIILSAADQAEQNDLLLVLISGGGSALVPAPAEGLSLEDKIKTTEILLACGADINEVNTVRKHLSRIKGGQLARAAAPADLHALILSDVLGDDPSAIASGPSVPDPTTFADSRNILEQRGAWKRLPEAVRRRIERGAAGEIPDTPKPGDPIFNRTEATLIGSNAISLQAMEEAARNDGYTLERRSGSLEGEAREEAVKWAAAMAEKLNAGGASGPSAISAGGETTVTLIGSGRGGRNQEFALAFAIAAEDIGLPECWLFLSGGTDGRDGPTDAAGGIVDPWSLRDMRKAGIDPRAALAENDSHAALKAADALLMTGATGTNVADLQIALTV